MIATNIQRLRKQKGLTQEELAEQAGITVRTIQRIENDVTTPRLYTLRKIAEVLEVPIEELTRTKVATNPVVQPDESLRRINLSCFSCLFIPYIHVLWPYHLWKKNKTEAGKKIINFQIAWTIALHGSLLLALCYNMMMVHWFNQHDFLVSYLWLALGMFLLNFFVILRNEVRYMTGK